MSPQQQLICRTDFLADEIPHWKPDEVVIQTTAYPTHCQQAGDEQHETARFPPPSMEDVKHRNAACHRKSEWNLPVLTDLIAQQNFKPNSANRAADQRRTSPFVTSPGTSRA